MKESEIKEEYKQYNMKNIHTYVEFLNESNTSYKIGDEIHLIEEDSFVYASRDGSLYVANDGILFEQKHKKFIDDILSEAGLSKDIIKEQYTFEKTYSNKPTGWKHKKNY